MKKFFIIFLIFSFFCFTDIKISKKPILLNLQKVSGEGEGVESRVGVSTDGGNLFFKFDCKEPYIKNIKTEKRENDTEIWGDDSVEIFIQTDIEKTGEYFHIVVNTVGKIYDKFLSPSIIEWDSKAEVKTEIKEDGYIINVKLPIESLKFSSDKKYGK